MANLHLHLQPPQAFNPDKDPAISWAKWKQKIKLYWTAAEIDKELPEKQRAILLHILGDYGLEVYNTLSFTETEENRSVNLILTKLTEYFEPYKNETYLRFLFFSCNQNENCSIDQYVTILKQKASDCGFGDLTESLIRDRIVCGIANLSLREKLLGIKNLSLTKCIDICRADEESRKQVKIMSTGINLEVNRLKYNKKQGEERKADRKQQGAKKGIEDKRKCHRCNLIHGYGKCPAWGKTCNKCHKTNHFAVCCKVQKVYEVECGQSGNQEHESEYEDNYLNLGSITETKQVCKIKSMNACKEWSETISVNNLQVKFKLDTGSEANILPLDLYNKLPSKTQIQQTGKSLLVYNKNKLNVLGSCKLQSCHKNITKDYNFYILRENYEPILGLEACIGLNLVKRIDAIQGVSSDSLNKDITSAKNIVDNFSDVFKGLGCFSKPCTIRVQERAIPHIARCRKIPLALHERVREALEKMQKDGVISKVEKATDWVNAMVVIEKKDRSLRICMDPRPLNKYIIRQKLELPTLETIFAQIGQAKYFTVLDASCAFYQIPLDKESSEICTFLTPFGRYKFNRLPYGLSNGPEVFQERINDFIEGLEGTIAYMDDILIVGRTLEEHNHRLQALLGKARKQNVKFKIDKLQLAKDRIKFLGHTISDSGIEIDSIKVEAIQNMQRPKNLKELQKFLGMINFLARFIKNVTEETAPLRLLLKKDTEWTWEDNSPQQIAFDRLKQLITNAPVLTRWNSHQQVTLATDASQYGIGGHISQNGHPVAYWSMSLNSAQRNYAQIEKELLAIVLGCEKFHYYLYGRPFVAWTDHKPLLGLVNKPIESLTPRLQRLLIRLLKYDITLQFISGKELYIPDVLSRVPLKENKHTDYLEDFHIRSVILVSDQKRQQLLNNTENDVELQTVKYYLRNGWPNQITSVKPEAKSYYPFKDEIYELDGFLFKENRLIIPKEFRHEVLTKIHSVHQGVISCQKRAQDSVFWPGINEQITNLVSSCLTCLKYSRSNPRQPLQPHPVPELPWEKIGIDFMKVGNSDFLVACDYHSKFIELMQLSKKDATAVIEALTSFFKSHGLPSVIMSDNGPPFNSVKFKNFLQSLDITSITSSPTYSQSNGLIERHIQTLKGLLIKSPEKHPYLTTMEYNSTPKSNLPSPSEMLNGRKFNTPLPRARSILKPLFQTERTVDILQKRQSTDIKYYNQHKNILPELKGGEVMMQQAPRKWVPAEVIAKDGNPESYIVQSQEGGLYRRNRVHLKEVPITPTKPRENPMIEIKQHEQLENTGSPQPSERKSTFGRAIKLPRKYENFITY